MAETTGLRIGDVLEEAAKARLFPSAGVSRTHSPQPLGDEFREEEGTFTIYDDEFLDKIGCK